VSYLLDPYHWDPTTDNNIPFLITQHLWLTGVSLLLALVIAFPIALLVIRYARWYTPVITTASIIYTIPSFAAAGYLVTIVGLNPPAIVIPLVAYGQVVLIRNIVAAIRGVDPALVDVGRAMGMNSTQLLQRIILPLSLPVIVAGIRIVAVTTIGILTVSQAFGIPSLSTLIFIGFGLNRPAEVVAGAILVSVLAIVTDLLLLGIQQILNRGHRVITA